MILLLFICINRLPSSLFCFKVNLENSICIGIDNFFVLFADELVCENEDFFELSNIECLGISEVTTFYFYFLKYTYSQCIVYIFV